MAVIFKNYEIEKPTLISILQIWVNEPEPSKNGGRQRVDRAILISIKKKPA